MRHLGSDIDQAVVTHYSGGQLDPGPDRATIGLLQGTIIVETIVRKHLVDRQRVEVWPSYEADLRNRSHHMVGSGGTGDPRTKPKRPAGR